MASAALWRVLGRNARPRWWGSVGPGAKAAVERPLRRRGASARKASTTRAAKATHVSDSRGGGHVRNAAIDRYRVRHTGRKLKGCIAAPAAERGCGLVHRWPSPGGSPNHLSPNCRPAKTGMRGVPPRRPTPLPVDVGASGRSSDFRPERRPWGRMKGVGGARTARSGRRGRQRYYRPIPAASDFFL